MGKTVLGALSGPQAKRHSTAAICRLRWGRPNALMFPQIFGKYVLERELASGGMARVYLATLRGAVGFEKRLVVKQIRPELSLDGAFVRRFVEEAKIAVELSHPNIVPVYELGVELGIYYIAMELCEGLTLTEVLMDTGPLDAAEGAYLGTEICRALDYAHRRGGIVHRDVTPRNVLLDEEGAVRLIDFGIAAPVSTARSTERVEIFGSPGHMPPEQIRGERLTAATDVFAVGVLLLEAWTGRPPFRRSTFEASAEALNEPVPALTLDHPELEPIAEIIASTVALRPADRPQNAETLARKLREFSRQFDSGDVAQRLGTRVRRARRRAQSSPRSPHRATDEPMTPAATPQALLSVQLPSRGMPGTPPQPPSTPPTALLSAPVTRTFAAREDLVEWTRKIASVPPLAAEGHAATGARLVAPGPPPSGVGIDEPVTRALPRSAPQAGSPGSSRRRFPWALATAAVVLAAVVGLLTPHFGPEPRPAARRGGETSAPVALSTSAAPVSGDEAPESNSPSFVSSSMAVVSPPRVTIQRAPSAAQQLGGAQLRLTADPQATVTVVGASGSQTLVTPVRGIQVRPGTYSVTFRSPTFGEPVVARVELGLGSSRSVHADFRAALPTVHVH